MTLYYNTLVLETHPLVYEPAEDSFLLAENLDVNRGDIALDMGTGTGILALMMAKKAKKVIGTDVNPYAIELAKKNAKINKTKNVEFRMSNLFKNVREKFDVIVFNPPYLPTDDRDLLGAAWSGGSKGTDITDIFLNNVKKHLNKNGRVRFITSSLNRTALNKNLRIVSEKKLPFETIYVIVGIY